MSVNRRKTAMVLHELEMSLGNFILDTEIDSSRIPENLIDEIVAREKNNQRSFDSSKIKNIVEATYIDELFQILIEITKDTSIHQFLLTLRENFIKYGIYEIRNTISHPNRPFLDPYWYRLAAVASDPIIDILGLNEVRKSLVSAENGEITDPPEGWITKSIWQIKNNLPERFDHAITGLVGRKKEADELLKLLNNPRVNTIAIVAPGGLGKTALALDLLDKVVKTPETSSWCDCCIFASLKTEMLTSEGLVKLDAIQTIDEIKSSLLKDLNEIYEIDSPSFESACELLKDKKALLFIDNLETLLIDNPKEFENFNYSLPQSWRLLITSRIAVSHASIISLEALKPNSAAYLARVYSSRRGGGTLQDDKLNEIATKCFCNPLAIRLTLDLFLSGKDIPQSISVANKEIASFSYSNLIETLPDISVRILEALFIEGNSSRSDLGELLGLNRDELAAGISELSNTSLLGRELTDDGEVFQLSGSITDLLLTNPKNISIRREIQDLVTKRRTKVREIDIRQATQKIPPYRWDYIPANIHQGLKILLTDLNRSMNKLYLKQEKAVLLTKKFADAEHIYGEHAIFNRGYGIIYQALNAKDYAIDHYKKAITLDPEDPNAKLLLALLYHSTAEYDPAIALFDTLISQGWHEKKDLDTSLAAEVVNGRFLTLLYSHGYQTILEDTKNWKNQGDLRGLYGAFRASALKREAETTVNESTEYTIGIMNRAIMILGDVFRNDGYTKRICLQAKGIFDELAFLLTRSDYDKDLEFSAQALQFINQHLTNSTEYMKYREDDYVSQLVTKLSKLQIDNNPFTGKEWSQITNKRATDIPDEIEYDKDFTIVSIARIPKGRDKVTPKFLFALSDMNEYFIHFENMVSLSFQEWRQLKTGVRLAVKVAPPEMQEAGKAKKVVEAHVLR
ncbi:NB-ARC domain-containing protein [Pseudomonas viridiflava]|uniref:NB-ARC domain-containing protein n=1 Tax=Pseudomonas viridiflava TaxID=33069 RepID=UPI000F01A0CD|nr:NB-ARC domain-containing protein [Pseudomonas viridiflava]